MFSPSKMTRPPDADSAKSREWAYASWRFSIYVAHGNICYSEIDEAYRKRIISPLTSEDEAVRCLVAAGYGLGCHGDS